MVSKLLNYQSWKMGFEELERGFEGPPVYDTDTEEEGWNEGPPVYDTDTEEEGWNDAIDVNSEFLNEDVVVTNRNQKKKEDELEKENEEKVKPEVETILCSRNRSEQCPSLATEQHDLDARKKESRPEKKLEEVDLGGADMEPLTEEPPEPPDGGVFEGGSRSLGVVKRDRGAQNPPSEGSSSEGNADGATAMGGGVAMEEFAFSLAAGRYGCDTKREVNVDVRVGCNSRQLDLRFKLLGQAQIHLMKPSQKNSEEREVKLVESNWILQKMGHVLQSRDQAQTISIKPTQFVNEEGVFQEKKGAAIIVGLLSTITNTHSHIFSHLEHFSTTRQRFTVDTTQGLVTFLISDPSPSSKHLKAVYKEISSFGKYVECTEKGETAVEIKRTEEPSPATSFLVVKDAINRCYSNGLQLLFKGDGKQIKWLVGVSRSYSNGFGQLFNISLMVMHPLVLKWDPGGSKQEWWNPSGLKPNMNKYVSVRGTMESHGIKTHQLLNISLKFLILPGLSISIKDIKQPCCALFSSLINGIAIWGYYNSIDPYKTPALVHDILRDGGAFCMGLVNSSVDEISTPLDSIQDNEKGVKSQDWIHIYLAVQCESKISKKVIHLFYEQLKKSICDSSRIGETIMMEFFQRYEGDFCGSQWDPGANQCASYITRPLNLQLWDPGGRPLTMLLSRYLHLEDKVNFEGGSIDENWGMAKVGQTNRFGRVYFRRGKKGNVPK